MEKAKRTYNGNQIDHNVFSTTGELMQAWVSNTPLACSNPRCQASIPPRTLFTRHALHHFANTWKHKGNQPFCRNCVPFYERD